MIHILKKFIEKVLRTIYKKKSHIKLGLYGPPNGGKTTIANRICQDWLGQDMGSVSNIPHETREIHIKEQINIKNKGRELTFNLVDTPGIATRIDYEDFVKVGMSENQAKERAREATGRVLDVASKIVALACVGLILGVVFGVMP